VFTNKLDEFLWATDHALNEYKAVKKQLGGHFKIAAFDGLADSYREIKRMADKLREIGESRV
jgi:hypothetical protein